MSKPLPIEVRFLKRYARRLHQAGTPAHQMESMLTAIAEQLGYGCAVWSSPTASFISVHRLDDEDELDPIPMQLIRTPPGQINLGFTSDLYELGEDLFEGRIGVEDAFSRLKSEDVNDGLPRWLRALSWGLCSAGIAVLLGASWLGVGVAGGIGTLLGAVFLGIGERANVGGLEALAALLATLVVNALQHVLPGLDAATVIMSALIVIVPGLSLTIAVTELSTNHLSSGAARLAGAVAVIFMLALGVLLGTVITGFLGWTPATNVAEATLPHPPDWFIVPAILWSSLGFAMVFSVRPRQFAIAMVAAIASYALSRYAVSIGGLEFGVLVTALLVAMGSNACARWLNVPASLMRVPGIILLVPGSLGYRAATGAMLGQGTGVEDAFMLMVVVATGLVGGLLIGSTLVPPRRYL
ncbi:threonine/serine exporter family protein [Marinihelvus fidelis]|uniref:Threonine/serine exporter family protein n=1 Tax=Marinihelvus fidelis TaxID=2613842 RepID=A0A5N0TCK7_9GAMM|nr:threonine/serine exporter family protein [Marinihelvus fidelis]KAA9131807.1 threonine/serine exporter family protein [Marinihelvus fidelis]